MVNLGVSNVSSSIFIERDTTSVKSILHSGHVYFVNLSNAIQFWKMIFGSLVCGGEDFDTLTYLYHVFYIISKVVQKCL